MPIRPENRGQYPSDWPVISKRIRFERAGGQCECDGRCGREPHDTPRCLARHGEPSRISGAPVVLTTAHLNHTPSDCRPENLMAACQSCHLAYDADHHALTRRANIAAAIGAVTLDGFDL
jgi:hypothetical protein